MNLDHDQIRDAAIADPFGFVTQAGNHVTLIEAIQRLPELALAAKAAIDAERRPGRFIHTGSSSLLSVKGMADSLAGRVARLTLYGFSRGEVRGLHDDYAASVQDDPSMLSEVSSETGRADYAEILSAGAYPDVRAVSDRIRSAWIDAYLQGVLGRDLTELRREVRSARAMAMLHTLAGRQSAWLVTAKLAEESGVPPRTVTGHVDLLHDVRLVSSIPPWTPNLAKREIGRSKSFATDSALALWMTRLTAGRLSRIEYSEAFGAVLKAFVASELLRQRTWSACKFGGFRFRDRDRDEVDIVLELDGGGVIGIEAKASSSFAASQFKGPARMRDLLGSRFVAGIVLNTSAHGYRCADRVFGAPVSALWQLATASASRPAATQGHFDRMGCNRPTTGE